MAHPTRTGDLVVFAYPPYQFDAATPGTLVAPSALLRPARLRARRAGPRRQHQHAGDVPRRRRRGSASGTVAGVRTIDLAPTLAFLLGIPEPQQSQGRVLLDVLKDGGDVQADLDRRAQRLPRPARADHARRSTAATVPVGGAAQLATMFDEEAAALPGPTLLLAGGDNVGASPAELGAARRTCRRSTSRTPGGWTRRRTATTSSTTACARLLAHQARANFPFLATNIVDDGDRPSAPSWVQAVGGVPSQRRHRSA